MSLLEVSELSVSFGRASPAVERVSFTVEPGQRIGVVGESGSGKSVTALACLGLLAESATTTGSVRWKQQQLLRRSEAEMARMRGAEFSMVFQEPLTALDPLMKTGAQVAEVLRLHGSLSKGEAMSRVLPMLASVGLDEPDRIAGSYPHQLSGGQRQRVLIAMALINQPDLVVCDEPTTALDVTVQAKVLSTLDDCLTRVGAACLFISHDLAVVSQVCTDLIVMRHGGIVESGPIAAVLSAPSHDYTRGLIAVAQLDQAEPGSVLAVVDDFATASDAGAGEQP